MKNFKKILGAYLASRRKALGVSIAWVAKQAGVRPVVISNLERGTARIPLHTVLDVVRVLRIDVLEFAHFIEHLKQNLKKEEP